MSRCCGKRKLRPLCRYQDLPLPTIAATATRVPKRLIARMRSEPTEMLLGSGTNGSAIVYPFWGSVKRRLLSADATPRVLLWVDASEPNGGRVGRRPFVLSTRKCLRGGSWQLLAAVAGVAERQAVRVSTNVEMTVSFLPFVFTAVAFGPAAAFLVGAVSNLAVLQAPIFALGCLYARKSTHRRDDGRCGDNFCGDRPPRVRANRAGYDRGRHVNFARGHFLQHHHAYHASLRIPDFIHQCGRTVSPARATPLRASRRSHGVRQSELFVLDGRDLPCSGCRPPTLGASVPRAARSYPRSRGRESPA